MINNIYYWTESKTLVLELRGVYLVSIKVDDYSNCKSNFKNYGNVQIFNFIKLEHSQPAITCPKLTIETLEQDV